MNTINIMCWGNVKLPSRGLVESAGFDLYKPYDFELQPGDTTRIPLNILIEIPSGHYGVLKERSSMSIKSVIAIGGIIDSDYRGEISIILHNLGRNKILFREGERVGQMIVSPCIQSLLRVMHQATETQRGSGGFDSQDVNVIMYASLKKS